MKDLITMRMQEELVGLHHLSKIKVCVFFFICQTVCFSFFKHFLDASVWNLLYLFMDMYIFQWEMKSMVCLVPIFCPLPY